MNDKIKILESQRGIAALLVVLFHASAFDTGLVQNAFVRNSDLFVDFFFCLSGFVIAFTYLDRLKTGADVVSFQTKRFFRLYPLHIVTLLVFLGIEVTKFFVEHKLGLTLKTPAFTVNDATSFAHNLFLTHAPFTDKATWNYPSWSISVEFFTYLIFAFLIIITSSLKMRLAFFTLCIVTAGTLLSLADNVLATTGAVAFARCIYCFFLGASLYALFPKVRPPRHSVAFGAVATITAIYFADHLPYPLIPLLFVATIWVSVQDDEVGLKRALSNRYLVHLGTISYGIYLWHAAVWHVIYNVLTYIAKVPRTGGTFDLSTTTTLGLIALGIGTTFALAQLSYQLIERPAARFGRTINWSRDQRSPVAS